MHLIPYATHFFNILHEEARCVFEPSKSRSGLAGGEIPFFKVELKLKQKAERQQVMRPQLLQGGNNQP
jgi:hypothetical protein